MWLCQCDCGNEVTVSGNRLRSGNTKSCGCLRRELVSKRFKTHGAGKTRLYRIWRGMRQRCNNPKHKYYKNYGGRGILVCSEWDSFEAFHDWADCNGYDESAPSGNCTLDRIDSDGNYCPVNCRFVSMKEQQNNKTNNLNITIDGQTKTLSEWVEEYGINYFTVYNRLERGWDPELAVTTPVREYNKHE